MTHYAPPAGVLIRGVLIRGVLIRGVMTGALGVLRDEPDFIFDLPMFMARGDRSNAGSIKKQMPAWAAREPQATYVVIPNAGHCCNLDNPAFFNAELAKWLQVTSP